MEDDKKKLEFSIKTLDSQLRSFCVDESMTVAQLKSQINTDLGIALSAQRIIFSGRMLLDHEKLVDVKVHGKVLHLVPRPPPSPSRPARRAAPRPAPERSERSEARNLPRVPPVIIDPLSELAAEAELQERQSPVAQRLDFIRQNLIQGWKILEHMRTLYNNPPSSDGTQDVRALNTTFCVASASRASSDSDSSVGEDRGSSSRAAQSMRQQRSTQGPNEAPAASEPIMPARIARPLPPNRNILVRPSDLAQLLKELEQLQAAFQPMRDAYIAILADYCLPGTEAERAWRRDMVEHARELMHCLCHMQHAASDLALQDAGRTARLVLRHRQRNQASTSTAESSGARAHSSRTSAPPAPPTPPELVPRPEAEGAFRGLVQTHSGVLLSVEEVRARPPSEPGPSTSTAAPAAPPEVFLAPMMAPRYNNRNVAMQTLITNLYRIHNATTTAASVATPGEVVISGSTPTEVVLSGNAAGEIMLSNYDGVAGMASTSATPATSVDGAGPSTSAVTVTLPPFAMQTTGAVVPEIAVGPPQNWTIELNLGTAAPAPAPAPESLRAERPATATPSTSSSSTSSDWRTMGNARRRTGQSVRSRSMTNLRSYQAVCANMAYDRFLHCNSPFAARYVNELRTYYQDLYNDQLQESALRPSPISIYRLEQRNPRFTIRHMARMMRLFSGPLCPEGAINAFLVAVARSVYLDGVSLRQAMPRELPFMRIQMRQFLARVVRASQFAPNSRNPFDAIAAVIVEQNRIFLSRASEFAQPVRGRELRAELRTWLAANIAPVLVCVLEDATSPAVVTNFYVVCTRFYRGLVALVAECCARGFLGFAPLYDAYIKHLVGNMEQPTQEWLCLLARELALAVHPNVPHDHSYFEQPLVTEVSVDDVSTSMVDKSTSMTDESTSMDEESTSMADEGTSMADEPAIGDSIVGGEAAPGASSAAGTNEHMSGAAEEASSEQPMPPAVHTPEPRAPAQQDMLMTPGFWIGGPQATSTPVASTDSGQFTADMEMRVVEENWEARWMPVLSEDRQRQQQTPPQQPFSEAYLSGLPARKRRRHDPAPSTSAPDDDSA